MEHDIDTLPALDSIHAIPHNSHHRTIERWPPSTEHAKRGPVQDWIPTTRLLTSDPKKDNKDSHMVFSACSSIKHNDDGDEDLPSKRASNRFPHAQPESLRAGRGIPIGDGGSFKMLVNDPRY
jgi:hypothetical protein